MTERYFIKGLEAIRAGDEDKAENYFKKASRHYKNTGDDEGLRNNWRQISLNHGVNPNTLNRFFDGDWKIEINCNII